MNETKDIISHDDEFDYSAVPSWYPLCFNTGCPLSGNCMHYFAGAHAPETLETCRCVLPHTLKNGHCRWFDKIKVMTMAVGFSHLYDNVLKSDFTSMRKTITAQGTTEPRRRLKDDVVPITAIREGEVPGIHEVVYDSDIDTITLRHSAKSRKGLALGALLAAEFIEDKKGYFTMKDLLKSER